ncbi:MAG: hypothetical protein RBS48_04855 [Ignavibacteriaceae bacterium]|jgi:phosphoglycerate-specific signal transduction histidine kinase|nr:hypothetical protein [Ignavibacteriaceae bacterium]
MESKNNMENVFSKLGDLKQFFVFGQKIVPVIQKIIDFMSDVVPLLENVNNSIQDSTSKIPKASTQINSVTSANEIATSEILDIIDAMFLDLSTIKTGLQELKNDENSEKIKSLNEVVEKIEMDSSRITISLQVQDITAQQLASVNHLIDSVQNKLSSLLCDLGKQQDRPIPVFDPNSVSEQDSDYAFSDGTFNENARYDRTTEKQDLVDSLVLENTKTSQEEIDKLFAK